MLFFSYTKNIVLYNFKIQINKKKSTQDEKRLYFTDFLMVVSTIKVFTQEKSNITLSSLSLSSGEGPLSSGLFFEANFTRGKDLLTMYLGERDICVYYLKPWGKKIFIGPSVEYYYNTPTLGIMAITTPFSKNRWTISTFSWAGVSAGTPQEKVELLKWRYLFLYNSLSIEYRNLTLSGAIMWYDTWGQLFELKYTKKITQNIKMFGSAGYSWYADNKYLFKYGLSYNVN